MAKADITHVFVGAAQLTGGTLGGLFRQRVGDDRWERLTKGLPEPPMIQAITVHPSDPQVIFVGTQDGPYRSDDGGNSFKRPDFPRDLQVWSITVHPTKPRVVYAGTAPVGSMLVVPHRQGRTRLNYLNPVPIQRIYHRWVSNYQEPWAESLVSLKGTLEKSSSRIA